MFINLSNHPSSNWPEKQIDAVLKYGYIVDLPFPAIDPKAETAEIANLAEKYKAKVKFLLSKESSGASAVHLMGELTFSFVLVARLQSEGIVCLASTTSRQTDDNQDGSKIIRFSFVRFREYPYLGQNRLVL